MPNLIAIRLHPEEPVTGPEFRNYLNGLIIRAYDFSFDHPEGDDPKENCLTNSTFYLLSIQKTESNQ